MVPKNGTQDPTPTSRNGPTLASEAHRSLFHFMKVMKSVENLPKSHEGLFGSVTSEYLMMPCCEEYDPDVDDFDVRLAQPMEKVDISGEGSKHEESASPF